MQRRHLDRFVILQELSAARMMQYRVITRSEAVLHVYR